MIEVLTSEQDLSAVAPEWRALWRSAPEASPFQSPEWLLGWWAQFGTGQPLLALLRREGRLLGVLPLYVLDEPPARKLLPIGVGISDYFDLLLAPDAPDEAAGALLRAALAEAPGVTECTLPDLPPDAALRHAASGWLGGLQESDPCPVLALPPAIPAGKRRDIRQAQHRAARIGGWTTEVATAASAQAMLEQLVTLHTARWDGAGVLADPPVLAFHRATVAGLVASGIARLQVLRFGQRVAAAYYALLDHGRRILFYLSGFDAAHASASPGTLLLARMIEDAVAEGRRELHFLRGAEAYKYAWGGIDRINAVRRLLPP